MLAQIEFESRVKNGMIAVPNEYLTDISEDVIVVLKRKTTPLEILQNKMKGKALEAGFNSIEDVANYIKELRQQA
jgi:hypothetical protein